MYMWSWPEGLRWAVNSREKMVYSRPSICRHALHINFWRLVLAHRFPCQWSPEGSKPKSDPLRAMYVFMLQKCHSWSSWEEISCMMDGTRGNRDYDQGPKRNCRPNLSITGKTQRSECTLTPAFPGPASLCSVLLHEAQSPDSAMQWVPPQWECKQASCPDSHKVSHSLHQFLILRVHLH